jgi:sec-independent protein translocase protein TatA
MELNTLLRAGMLGGQELFIILIIILILFGGNKIANLGDGLGKGIRNFRRSLKGEDEERAEVIEAEVVDSERSEKGSSKRIEEEG